MQELTKITGYISFSQIPTSRNPAEGLDLAMQTQADPYTVIQIDESLTRLENSLPPFQPNTPIIEPTDRRLFLLRLR